MPDTVTDVEQLLKSADVTQIRFHEVSAKRSSEDDDSEDVSIEVLVREDECEIGVRCRVTTTAGGGSYVADVEAVFETKRELNIPPDVMQEFLERIGVMVAYPYARTAISDSAGKLGLRQPVLKLLRPGDVHLERETAEAAPTEGDETS